MFSQKTDQIDSKNSVVDLCGTSVQFKPMHACMATNVYLIG